jgi:HlyD family secretion protein
MSKKKVFLIIPIICVVVFGAFYYYKNKQPETADNVLYGNIDIREVALGFRVVGKLEKVLTEEGDSVKEGELLATLDKKPFQESLNLAKANLRAGSERLKNAKQNLDRAKKLYKAKSASKKQLQNAESAFLELLHEKSSLEASLQIAKTALNDTNLFAPSEGIIIVRSFEKGSQISPAESVLTLSLASPVYARGYVSETSLGKIQIGQKAKIKTDSGEEFEGQIGYISPRAEFTPKTVETRELRTDLVYRVRVLVKNPNGSLKQGMPITIMLHEK